MVFRCPTLFYLVQCDNCDKYYPNKIEKSKEVYNCAQAVRSIGWSYGKDGKIKCEKCRRNCLKDKYRYK